MLIERLLGRFLQRLGDLFLPPQLFRTRAALVSVGGFGSVGDSGTGGGEHARLDGVSIVAAVAT
jgi:hypothetical protein